MLFNSIQFVFFFVIVTSLYYACPYRFRWLLLLASSCYFYMAFVPIYILILAFTILIDYAAGIWIQNSGGHRRRFFLVLSLTANIGVLAFFKYYNFLNTALASPLPYLSILLPIGLSFHTFQAMSYTIEVYRGNQPAEKNLGIYALYVMFYPQLVAGPIERPQNLLHQFREKHPFAYDNCVKGLRLILIGFFKKLVIADRLAIYVNTTFDHAHYHTGLTLLVATLFFAFQIYCDFSGYSDIAIGTARVMGFKLMTNFNRPYFSRSVAEFWKRWHISLSTWFKDYLYIPLGGNRVGIPRWYMNLMIVFLLSGLWHGANWTFLVWGGINGGYLILALVARKPLVWIDKTLHLDKFPFIPIAATFLLECFAWIFFRASSIREAWYIVRKIATFRGPVFNNNPSMIVYPLIGIFILLVSEFIMEYRPHRIRLFDNPLIAVRYLSYAVVVLLILMIGVFDGGQFIYFQF